MKAVAAGFMLTAGSALSASSVPMTVTDYIKLHYLYMGAIGEQGCAEHKPSGPRKRRFEARYAERVRSADTWFKARYSETELSNAATAAYGGPEAIDVRDCVRTEDGEPAFRDTPKFVAELRLIEREMRGAH